MKPKQKQKSPKPVVLIANGDLRLTANQKCWPEQQKMESILTRAIEAEGFKVQRGHAYDEAKQHGFIDSQKMGMEVFRGIDPECAADRCRGGLAVQPSCAARASDASRARSLPWRIGAAPGRAWWAC